MCDYLTVCVDGAASYIDGLRGQFNADQRCNIPSHLCWHQMLKKIKGDGLRVSSADRAYLRTHNDFEELIMYVQLYNINSNAEYGTVGSWSEAPSQTLTPRANNEEIRKASSNAP